MSSPNENPMRNTSRKRGERLRNRSSFSTNAASGSGNEQVGDPIEPIQAAGAAFARGALGCCRRGIESQAPGELPAAEQLSGRRPSQQDAHGGEGKLTEGQPRGRGPRPEHEDGSPERKCRTRPSVPRNKNSWGKAAASTSRNTTISRTRLRASRRTSRSRIPAEQHRLKNNNASSQAGAHNGIFGFNNNPIPAPINRISISMPVEIRSSSFQRKQLVGGDGVDQQFAHVERRSQRRHQDRDQLPVENT